MNPKVSSTPLQQLISLTKERVGVVQREHNTLHCAVTKMKVDCYKHFLKELEILETIQNPLTSGL